MKFEDWWYQFGPDLGITKAQAIIIWVAAREALMQEFATKYGFKLPPIDLTQKQ